MSITRQWDLHRTLHSLHTHNMIMSALKSGQPTKHSLEGQIGDTIVRYSPAHNVWMRITLRDSVIDWDRDQIIT